MSAEVVWSTQCLSTLISTQSMSRYVNNSQHIDRKKQKTNKNNGKLKKINNDVRCCNVLWLLGECIVHVFVLFLNLILKFIITFVDTVWNDFCVLKGRTIWFSGGAWKLGSDKVIFFRRLRWQSFFFSTHQMGEVFF